MNDPDTQTKALGETPAIHRTASVRDTTFGRFCEVGARSRVAESTFGDYAYASNDTEIIYTDVGPFCSIAAHARINPGNHPVERVAMNHFTYRSSAYGLGPDEASFFDWRRGARCALGADVWVGHGAIVLPGRQVGHGAIVGAGAVVTHDVPAWAIVAGNPARLVRMRFEPDITAALERIAWWTWPQERLRIALEDFRRLDAESFCRKYDPV